MLVFGEGPLRARVMLVGEAPGEREALEGRPFVGRAGKNLDAFLEGAHIRREELYVTNAVKFRPTRTSAAGRTVNRPPSQEEARLFMPWLAREIALVDPGCVVTLGNVALRAVAEKRLTIGEVHGQLLTRRAGRCFPSITPPRSFTTPRCGKYTPPTSPRWRVCSRMEKYNIDFTPFVMQTGFHCAGNVYDSTCVFLLVIRRAAGVAKAAVAA